MQAPTVVFVPDSPEKKKHRCRHYPHSYVRIWRSVLWPLGLSCLGAIFCFIATIYTIVINGGGIFYFSSMYGPLADDISRVFFMIGYLMILSGWSITFYVEYLYGHLRRKGWFAMHSIFSQSQMLNLLKAKQFLVFLTGFCGLLASMVLIGVPLPLVGHAEIAGVLASFWVLHVGLRCIFSWLIVVPLGVVALVFYQVIPNDTLFSTFQVLLGLFVFLFVSGDIIWGVFWRWWGDWSKGE